MSGFKGGRKIEGALQAKEKGLISVDETLKLIMDCLE